MKDVILSILNKYEIPGESYTPVTSKTFKINCDNGNCFFLKECNELSCEKYNYLRSMHVNNILYPLKNNNDSYITNKDNKNYILFPYLRENNSLNEVKIYKLGNELEDLHQNTTFKKELSLIISKKKFEEIYNYLQYKFNVLEAFVRTIESRTFDENSILILKEYHNILDAKKIMGNLNKKIIDYIKMKKSVEFTYIHNNPKLSHILLSEESNYLISLDNGKIGIPVLDIVKLYIESEDVNIDRKDFIMNYFNSYNDDFYFNYFCFFVMLYYLKTIIVIDKDYVTSQSFVYAGKNLKKFIECFNLK